MAITPQNPGTIDTPNTLTPDSAGSVAVPNTLTPESAGSVAVPNTLTPESAGSISVPNSLSAESAGSVAVPNTLNAETAGSVAVPNTLTSSDAKGLPRALTPTVDINYAAGLFAQNGSAVAESDLITFARASTATFINRQLGSTGRWEYFLDTAASGVQRIEYDAATGENLGALIEQASTNLCLRSEEFDNASWAKSSATITANDTQAPDLTTSADKLEAGSTGSIIPTIHQSVSTSSSTKYTISAFVKRAEASVFQIMFNIGNVSGNPRVNFDLASGTVGSQDAGIDGAGITSVGDDWLRVFCTVTTLGTSLLPLFALMKAATDTRAQTNSWTAGDGLYIWGAQIEQTAIPTSYIPTTTAAVSRLADQVSIPVAGNVPSGDISQRIEFTSINENATQDYISEISGSAGASFFTISADKLRCRHGDPAFNSVSDLDLSGVTNSAVTVFNGSSALLSIYIGGLFESSAEQTTAFVADQAGAVGIGQRHTLTNQLNGHIKRFTIYDEALTADEVAQL